MNENQLTQTQQQSPALLSPNGFEMAQRMATALSKSNLIPEIYRDNLPNCLIALEMANRMGASPMMVMQNLYIVHGKPAWSSQFIIAAINATRRFSPLRFDMTGEGDKRQCIAWAIELATSERLEGPPVSMQMAKAEGWLTKNGSKWQTMPELMLRYRSATFFGRLYAPEVLMGMREESEVIDVDATVTTEIPRAKIQPPVGIAESATTQVTLEPQGPVTLEEPPKRGRGKGRKPATAQEEGASTLPAKLLVLLTEKGYQPDELIRVAIENNWCETTTETLSQLADDKLQLFLDDFGSVCAEIESLRAR